MQSKLNQTSKHLYRSSNLSIPSSSSFNDYFRSSSANFQANITPLCSDADNESDQENESELDPLPSSIAPGVKGWYMSFPSDNDQIEDITENHQDIKDVSPSAKSAPLINKHDYINIIHPDYSNHDSLTSFDIGIANDFCYENIKHQQTDIFSSQLYPEGDIHGDGDREQDAFTMMGYMEQESINMIPGQWKSRIYSEGNIKSNRMEKDHASNPEIICDEGTKDTDYQDDEDENEEDEDIQMGQHKGITFMGHVHTNDGYENDGDDEEEDDEVMYHEKKEVVTLMGLLNVSQKLSFGVPVTSEMMEEEDEDKEMNGVTLMGYFDTKDEMVLFNEDRNYFMCNNKDDDNDND